MTTDENKKPDGHKSYEIVVNGQKHQVQNAIVTFEEIVELGFPEHAGNPDITVVITYRKAHKPNEGSLTEGGKVEVEHHGTIFNVTFTRRS